MSAPTWASATGGGTRFGGRWPAMPLAALQSTVPAVPTRHALSGLLAFPFDAVRAQYGAAVELGLVQRSMLASRKLERCLDRLERLSLGPFARRV